MKKKFTIALSGNPNSGKTTVFNAITGARQTIANYPGVTVEKKSGTITHKKYEIEIVDLPGTYSLTAYSLEEIVARNFLFNERPDLVVDIVDASNLDRNLYLALQLRELGIPLIIALNMVDVAKSRGIDIDHQQLAALLDVPIVTMVARSNKGIRELLDKIVETAALIQEWRPLVISYGLDIDLSLSEIEDVIVSSNVSNDKYSPRWLALKCLESDRQILEFVNKKPKIGKRIKAICEKTSRHVMATLEEDPEGIIADHRYGYITGVTKKTVKRRIESRINFSDKIDRVLTNRIIGPLCMGAILYGIYVFTFWASKAPLQWLEVFFDYLKVGISALLPAGKLQSLIISGVIDGMGGVLGFVPLIMFMFFTIAIMEDSGYLARIAYMLDRVLSLFGLHGNSVIPLIISGGISGGCAVPGVLATRTLREPKERIATLLVVPFMNCGAKLPVYAMLIAAFFAKHQARMLFILTLLSWAFALFAAKLIRSTVLKGPNTPFVMELPPYRSPTLKGLFIHTWERTWHYIKKAGTIILAISVLLWVMMTFPGLSGEQKKTFENGRAELTKTFLDSPGVNQIIRGERGLADFNVFYESYVRASRENDVGALEQIKQRPLFDLAKAVFSLETDETKPFKIDTLDLRIATYYRNLKQDMANLNLLERRLGLDKTVAGWIGHGLEIITRPLGFDYRVNIALVGGFAAKEVIISSLGTAYSLGEVDTEISGSLSQRLKRDPRWNPLQAFTFIVFIMLYVPCLPTVVSIRKESSWRWAGFSIAFNLVVAYSMALLIRKVGLLMGIGI